MASIPCLAPRPSPSLPLEISEFPIRDPSAKSRLRAFFSRKRSEKSAKEPAHCNVTTSTSVGPPPLPKRQDVPLPPVPITTRSRSTTRSSQRSKSTHRTQKDILPRTWTSADPPPPLFRVYPEAVLRETLDIPSSLADLPRQAQGSSVSGDSPSQWDQEAMPRRSGEFQGGEATNTHQRHGSRASPCSRDQKLLILVHPGSVLQYNSEGLNDRLPEKILELGPDSSAIASDAVPGKRWVLRISSDGNTQRRQRHTPKNSWSRLPFRSTENKRLVDHLFLVFDSARTFDTWLTTVRKEIDTLASLTHRPDSNGHDAEHPPRPSTSRLHTPKTLQASSRSSPHLPLTPFEHARSQSSPESSSSLLLPPLPSSSSRKSTNTESSVSTTTELDQLRDSSVSDSHSIRTAARTSVGDSSPAASPRQDSFPERLLAAKPLPPRPATACSPSSASLSGQTSAWSMPSTGDARKSSAVDSRLLSTFALSPCSVSEPGGRQTTQAEKGSETTGHRLLMREPDFARRKGLESEMTNSRPISTVAPLPDPGAWTKGGSRHHRRDGSVSPASQPATPSERPHSSHSHSVKRDSLNDHLPRRRPSYSLFPKRCGSLDYSQRAFPSPLPSPPTTWPGANATRISGTGTGFPFPHTVDPDGRTEGEPLRPDSVPRPGHRRYFTVDTSRSYHVHDNDVAIAATTIDVPVTTSLASPFGVPVPKLSVVPRKERQLTPQKSLPTLRCRATSPLGPPPSGPLPALPCEAPSSSRHGTTSHERSKSSVSRVRSVSISVSRKSQSKHGHGSARSVSTASATSTSQLSSKVSSSHSRTMSSRSSRGFVSNAGPLMSFPGAAPKLEVAVPVSPAFTPTTTTFPASISRRD